MTSRLPSAIHALARARSTPGDNLKIINHFRQKYFEKLVRVSYAPAERPARLTADAATPWARTPPRRRDASTPAAPLAAHGP